MCKEALSNPGLDLRTEKQDKVEVFRISLEDNGLPLRSLRKMTELEIIEILQRGQCLVAHMQRAGHALVCP